MGLFERTTGQKEKNLLMQLGVDCDNVHSVRCRKKDEEVQSEIFDLSFKTFVVAFPLSF